MIKNKILFVLHLPPPVHGSAMVGKFIKDSKIINDEFECSYINLGTSKSIDEIGKNVLGKLFRYFLILLTVLRNLISNRPDLVYFAITAKGIAFYKDAAVVILIKLFRVKLVYHFHNKGVKPRQEKLVDKILYRFVFKDAEAILLSKYLYPDVQKYFPEAKAHICPNGVPNINIPTTANDQKQKGKAKILFLSNLIETKGVYVLMEACAILKQKGILFECDFIGGEGDITADKFRDKVKLLDLDGQVSYLGKKYGVEKNQAFKTSDIFAFPTYYDNECFPLVLLEAMQHGIAIVSTFEGGIRDIIEDGKQGYLVPQKNIQLLADKLEILIKNHELRNKMGSAAQKKYEMVFTLEKFEIRIKTILCEYLNQV